MTYDGLDPRRKRLAARRDFRLRIFLPQFVDKFLLLIAEIHGRDASMRGADKDSTDGRVRDRISDFHSLSSALIVRRRHPELCVPALVDAARLSVARLVQSRGHVLALPQLALEALHAQGVGKFFGSETRGLPERAAKRSRRGPEFSGKLAELDALFVAAFEYASGSRDERCGGVQLIRPAT